MEPAQAYRSGVQVLCVFTALFLGTAAAFVRFTRNERSGVQ
jgi:hypothetical protein